MRETVRHPIVELAAVRVKELLREPEMVFWVFGFPIIMALALGVAFRVREPVDLPIGVDASAGGAAVHRTLAAAEGIDARLLTPPEGARALRDGEIHLLVLPGDPPRYRFDAARAESRLARLLVDDALQRAAGRADVWDARDSIVSARGQRYIDWLIPGLLGMNIMGSGLWGIGFSVVQARTKKLLKRLVASPMRRWHYLLAQILARLVFLLFEVVTLVGFAWLVFDVPVRGSWAALALVAFIGAMAFSGVGTLLASRARTVEAVSGLMNLVTVPMWILSGVFFASSNFPEAAQPAIQLLPLTALIDALRAVMMDAAPIAAVWPQLVVLGLWGTTAFVVALRIFRWR